jgi:hypothetical protein
VQATDDQSWAIAGQEVRVSWLLSTLACGFGQTGELWLRVDHPDDDGDRFTLTLPASALREPGEPTILDTVDGPVDLRPEARRLRRGAERVWTLPDDGGTATLLHVGRAEGAATEVSVGITGKKGQSAMSFAVPLQPEDLGRVRDNIRVDLDLPIAVDAAACAQWRRSPPMPVLEIVGPKGNGLRVETR